MEIALGLLWLVVSLGLMWISLVRVLVVTGFLRAASDTVRKPTMRSTRRTP